MPIIRLILLVAVLGGLTLLLVQNWSPVLPLVFLGVQTKPLPLALWILFSTFAGAFTCVLITVLGKFTADGMAVEPKTSVKKTPPSNRVNPRPVEPPSYSRTSPSNQREYTTNQEFDDWDSNSNQDDWDFDGQSSVENPKTSAPQPQPKNNSQSGVYSYSAQEPKNTSVGKTESIYDADYRVIIPPFNPPGTEKPEEEDDWGDLFTDDDFEDDQDSSRRP
jgi:hypothetical protein